MINPTVTGLSNLALFDKIVEQIDDTLNPNVGNTGWDMVKDARSVSRVPTADGISSISRKVSSSQIVDFGFPFPQGQQVYIFVVHVQLTAGVYHVFYRVKYTNTASVQVSEIRKVTTTDPLVFPDW